MLIISIRRSQMSPMLVELYHALREAGTSPSSEETQILDGF